MAIINAKRVTVIGLKNDKPEILKSLQSLGAVQIEENTFTAVDKIETSETIEEVEQKLADVSFVLELLKPYDETKKSMFAAKPIINEEGLDELKTLERKVLIAVESLKEYAEELSWARANITRSENLIMQVEPYRLFDETFEALGTNYKTYSTVGLIPLEEKENYFAAIEEFEANSYFEVLEDLKESFVVFAVVHTDELKAFRDKMKTLSFTEAKYEHYDDSPQAIIDKEVKDIVGFEEQEALIKTNIAELISMIANLESLEDYYSALLQREKAGLVFGYTKNTFVLEGWINEKTEADVVKAIEDVSEATMVDFRYPLEDEKHPTILENPILARPFEAITEMYDTPSAKGIDPNMLMAPFYFIFFGMMVSDAGYGLILAIACTFILWKTRPAGMFGKILGVVAFGGISTFIWGILFGGWFGIAQSNLPPLLQPKWFNPLDQPLLMLGLCLGIGAFQIVFGLGVGATMNIKRKKPWSALFDQVSWIMIILGLLALLVGGVIGEAGVLMAAIGKYAAMAGAGLILIFAGRKKKGLGKVTAGLIELYGITGYLSDILSYSRIFGMGLATGVIAMVFNTIAGMFTNSWFLIPIAVVILVVGHTFNLGINTLGAYVHSCRLQYIEYYGKFFEGGGIAFRPLRADIKHYRFEK